MNRQYFVGVLVPNCNAGGTERIAQIFAEYLIKLNYEIVIISMAKKKLPYKINCKFETIDNNLPSGKLSRLLYRYKSLKNIVSRHRIDVMISMGEYPNMLCALLDRKILKINRLTNSKTSLSGCKGLVTKCLMKMCFHLTNFTIVPTTRLAKELGLYSKKNKILSIPNPINIGNLVKLSQEDNQELNRFQQPYFLHVGQLVFQKDHETLIKSYALYRKAGGELKLILVGKGELESEIRNLLKKYGLEEYVILYGWSNNPAPLIRNARALVLTSRWEGMPNVILEAMALGCPIISSNCPTGPEEMLSFGEYGRLFDIGDTQSLAKELYQFDTNKDWQFYWGLQAKKRSEAFEDQKVFAPLIRVLTKDNVVA